MAYVDLNPLLAKMANTPEGHTIHRSKSASPRPKQPTKLTTHNNKKKA